MTHRKPRYRVIDRSTRSCVSLDEQLPAAHPVRTLWEFTSRLDFSDFDADVKAVEGHPGKPPLPPQLLFTLWLFALIEGVCLARELARRCRRDLPYEWLCGGLWPDYHTLSDFHAAFPRDEVPGGHAGRGRGRIPDCAHPRKCAAAGRNVKVGARIVKRVCVIRGEGSCRTRS